VKKRTLFYKIVKGLPTLLRK